MAGLKFEANLEDTVKNILKLKKGIDALKKSLLEVASVPNSDASVKKLETQIEKATRKLQEYQDKYSQLKKAYDDLNASNAAVKRVHEETKALQSVNQWLVANTKAVQDSDVKVQQLRKQFDALSEEQKIGEKGVGILLQVQQQVAVRKKEEEAIRKNIKAQKDQIIQSESEEGSITALRKQLTQLIITYDNMGRVRREGKVGKELLAQVKVVQAELSAAEQASGRFQRNVGNYASAFNGLGMSIQQIARELPSLTMGVNMFFLAISNNLPIFFDEIQKARKEYSAYIAELKKGNTDVQKVAPVWKQVASGILSWNTALVVGITLLSTYGKDVVEWVGNLFKAKTAILDLLTAEQQMALARKNASNSIKDEQTQLDILYNKLKNTTTSTEERTAAASEWMRKYPQYANVLDKEGINLSNLESAYKSLSKEIYANAVARNYADKMAELSLKKDQELIKARNQYVSYLKAQRRVEQAQRRVEQAQQARRQGLYGSSSELSKANDELNEANSELDKNKKLWLDMRANVKQYDEDMETISNHINTLDLFPQPEEGTYDYWQQQKTNADKALKGIRSDIKDTLDAASKDNKDLFSLGIDESTVKVYQKAVNDIAEANKKLDIYNNKTADSTSNLNALSSQEDKIFQLRQKHALDRKRQAEDLEYQAAQARIDAMTDGSEKVQAQMRLDHQKEIQEIQRQKQNYIRVRIQEAKEIFDAEEELRAKENKDYKKKTFDASTVTVDTSIFDEITKTTIERQGNDLAEYYKEVLTQYQDYATKRLEAKKKFDADLKKLEKAGGTEGQKAELEYQREETYKAIDKEFAMREDSFQSWADGIANMALEELQRLLVNTERELERMEFANKQGVSNDQGLAEQRAKVTALREQISDVNNKNKTSPDKRSIKDWQDLYKTLSKVEKEFEEVGDAIGGTIGEVISAAGSVTASTLSMIDSIVSLGTISADNIKGVSKATAQAISTVEKASVILAIVSAALQIATKIVSFFKQDDGIAAYEKAKETYDSYIQILDKVIDKQLELAETLSGENAKAAYKEAINLIQQQSNAAKELGKAYLNSGASKGFLGIGSSASRGKKEVEEMSAEGWTQAAKALGISVQQFKNAVGGRMTGLFDLTEEQLVNLQKYAPSFWAQLDDDTRNYANQIVDGVEQIMEVLEQEMENATGVSWDSFTSDILDSLYDVEKGAEDIADDIADYMRKALIKSMYVKQYEPEMRKWYEKWAEYTEDGILSDTEQSELDRLKDGIIQGATESAKLINEQWAAASTTQQQATAGGYETMSQDAATELNGRFAALQVAGEEIKNQTILSNEWLSKIYYAISSSYNLPDIAGEARNVAVNSNNSQLNIVFPETQINTLSDEVSGLRVVIDEMRDWQAMGWQNIDEMTNNVGKMAKTTPDVVNSLKTIKDNSKNW